MQTADGGHQVERASFAADRCVAPCQEFVEIEGFSDVVIGTVANSLNLVFLTVVCRQHDGKRIGIGLTHLLHKFEA